MKFIDTCEIMATAGAGGNGCMSFRREAYVPRGGPDGGNGGDGGNIILIADDSKHTLMDIRQQYHYRAERGVHGKGKGMHGRRGKDQIIKVPCGTIVVNADTDEILADLTEPGQQIVVAKGGKGGRGNANFMSPTHRAPTRHEPGADGEKVKIYLELKLLADVGIIGFPNAGKSTFISTVSAAKPKVADYPFTTLVPHLGVVKGSYGNSFVLADMPGLIEGAADGIGLGIQFLKHIERTKILLHLIDASVDESMVERYNVLRSELHQFSEEVAQKPEVIGISKMDYPNEENIAEFEQFLKTEKPDVPYFKFSSLMQEGTKEITDYLDNVVSQYAQEQLNSDEETL